MAKKRKPAKTTEKKTVVPKIWKDILAECPPARIEFRNSTPELVRSMLNEIADVVEWLGMKEWQLEIKRLA